MTLKNYLFSTIPKLPLLLNREVFRLFLGDVDLFYGEILAGED